MDPFNRERISTESARCWNSSFSQLDHESPEFRKYAVRYAKAIGLPHTTEEDFMEVFESLADMPSFNVKGPLPKLARCGVGGGVLLVGPWPGSLPPATRMAWVMAVVSLLELW